jgi:hypothetical protein
MACFSLQFIEQLLIWLVVFGAVFAIINLLIPFVLSGLGSPVAGGVGVVISALRIVFWAAVAIAVIMICFDLISCLIGHGGLSLPRATR